MSLKIFPDKIKFDYKSKKWQYQFDEIKELGLLRKRKSYFLQNGTFIASTAIAYCGMIFSELTDLNYIIPVLLCYILIITSVLKSKAEFVYFVFVKDIYKSEIRTKIASKDRLLIGRQIDQYLDLQFERNIGRTA